VIAGQHPQDWVYPRDDRRLDKCRDDLLRVRYRGGDCRLGDRDMEGGPRLSANCRRVVGKREGSEGQFGKRQGKRCSARRQCRSDGAPDASGTTADALPRRRLSSACLASSVPMDKRHCFGASGAYSMVRKGSGGCSFRASRSSTLVAVVDLPSATCPCRSWWRQIPPH
jgi:hypothetical protein